MKEAMRKILPHEILHKKKVGFNPPLPDWINRELQPLIARLLAPEVIRKRGIFRPAGVARLVSEHAENKRDNALKIWALLMLEVWQRLYLDREPEDSVQESFRAALAQPRG